jgi:hypothetical protein
VQGDGEDPERSDEERDARGEQTIAGIGRKETVIERLDGVAGEAHGDHELQHGTRGVGG